MKFLQESLTPGMEKKRKISEERMSKDVGFVKSGGVAHVGPDVEDMKYEKEEIKAEKIFKDDQNTEEALNIKSKQGKRFRNSFGGLFPKFLSKSKNISVDVSRNPDENRAYIRAMTRPPFHNENLKTMPESKKQRINREKIKKVLNNQENLEDASKESDPMGSVEE